MRRARSDNSASGLGARVMQSIAEGDVTQASRQLEVAVRQQPSNVTLRFQLAVIYMSLGRRAPAAIEFTRVLRLEPGHRGAAQRLGEILAQGRLPDTTTLDTQGLVNALAHTTVDRDLVGAAAFRQMCYRGTLTQALRRCREQGAEVAARNLVVRRTADPLRDELLLTVLSSAIVIDPDLERLLTALRRVLLLDVEPQRLLDPDLQNFAVALGDQAAGNEYVFAETSDESARLDATPVDVGAALAGDRQAGLQFLLYSLYRDPLRLLPDELTAEDATPIYPEVFAASLGRLLAERQKIRSVLRDMPRHGQIISETSRRVAAQYRTHPYPRWRSLDVVRPGKYVAYLHTFFSAAQLAFSTKPFQVLIAGCGTGRQAVSAALDYGPTAQVQAIDISAPSLGYAAMMAERLEAANLSFALADIGEIAGIEPSWRGRFQVIECGGVLHHMARPFEAWRGLLDCLAPGGIMLIGLYSSTARRELDTLRAEPEYPGPGCSDAALKAYRQNLLGRGPDEPGASYMRSRDAHTSSGFRDFFLHVSEQTTTIAQIAAFLEVNGLAFNGFVTVPFASLARRFPDEVWPGRLDRWAELEAERPALFIGMYQFWVTRR